MVVGDDERQHGGLVDIGYVLKIIFIVLTIFLLISYFSYTISIQGHCSEFASWDGYWRYINAK